MYSNNETTVRVGIFYYDGLYGTDALGNPYGYGFEYLEEIAKYTGFNYEYIYASRDECIKMLQDGEIDMMDTLPFSADDDSYFITQLPTISNFGMLTVSQDSAINFEDIESFNNMTIGFLRSSNRKNDFEQYSVRNNFNYISRDYDTFVELTNALTSKEVDAIVTTSGRKIINEKIVGFFDLRSFYFAVSKSREDILVSINNALEQIQLVDRYYNDKLADVYFTDIFKTVALTSKELEFIETTEPLTVVYDSFWPPFESYDEESNMAVGLNVDIFFQVANQTRLPFEFIHGKTYDEAISMVRNGEADMLLSYDSNFQKAAELGVHLTDTFLESPIAIIGKNDVITEESVFAISQLHPMIFDYISANYPKNKIVVYLTIEECYIAVDRGTVDFTVENIYAATNAIQNFEYDDLSIVSVTTLMDRFSFMVRGDSNPALISILNKYIQSLSSLETNSLLSKYTVRTNESVIERFFRENAFILLITLAIFFVLWVSASCFAIISLKKGNKKIWKQTYIDPVTNLPNVVKLKEDLHELLLKRDGKRYYIYQCDVSKFKLINELYGIDEGNVVLRVINEGLCNAINKIHQETGNRCLVGRKDRDTFVVVIGCGHDVMKKGTLIEEYLPVFYNYINEHLNHELHFYVGKYLISENDNDVNYIIERINYAHNHAKKIGALDVAQSYDENLKKMSLIQREIENKMHRALHDNEFTAYIQPKYCLKTNTIIGAEALVRWLNDDGTVAMYPNDFIPLFEQNGFIVDVDFYILTVVCKLLQSWYTQGIPLIPISVNFSRQHLKNNSFVEELCAIVDDFGFPKKFIEIELTESSILETSPLVFETVLADLKKAGFLFSMDDFGSGYSSLGLLKDFFVDTIKIDRSFFVVNKSKERANLILEHVINMADSLNIHTVAEGIEEKHDVDFLRKIGCETVQGYYFSKPLTIHDFENLYTSSVLKK